MDVFRSLTSRVVISSNRKTHSNRVIKLVPVFSDSSCYGAPTSISIGKEKNGKHLLFWVMMAFLMLQLPLFQLQHKNTFLRRWFRRPEGFHSILYDSIFFLEHYLLSMIYWTCVSSSEGLLMLNFLSWKVQRMKRIMHLMKHRSNLSLFLHSWMGMSFVCYQFVLQECFFFDQLFFLL